jgi:hypothetical protein
MVFGAIRACETGQRNTIGGQIAPPIHSGTSSKDRIRTLEMIRRSIAPVGNRGAETPDF